MEANLLETLFRAGVYLSHYEWLCAVTTTLNHSKPSAEIYGQQPSEHKPYRDKRGKYMSSNAIDKLDQLTLQKIYSYYLTT